MITLNDRFLILLIERKDIFTVYEITVSLLKPWNFGRCFVSSEILFFLKLPKSNPCRLFLLIADQIVVLYLRL